MGLEFSEKLDLLGAGAGDECDASPRSRESTANLRGGASAGQSCAANPSASVVTHHATRPIRASEILLPSPRGRGAGGEGKPPCDLKPWLSSSIRSDGKRIPIVNTMVAQPPLTC